MKALYTMLFALGLAYGTAATAMDHMEQGAMEMKRPDTAMQPGAMRMEQTSDKMKKEKKSSGKKSKKKTANKTEMKKPDSMMKQDGMDHGSMQRMP